MTRFFGKSGKALYIRLLAALTLSLVGCSNSNDNNSVPVAAPVDIAASLDTGGEIVVVQFNRTSGIGPDNNREEPIYQYALSTSPDGAKTLLDKPVSNTGNPIRLYIALKGADTSKITSKNIVEYDFELNKVYYVWVRAVYPTYGTSEWSKTLANATIPSKPTAIENANVEKGDKRLVVSWTKKEGEQYGVNLDDCPKNGGQLTPGFWKPTNIIDGDNIVFSVKDNTATHKLCVASTNARGSGEWHIFGTVSGTAITYDAITAEAATEPPAKPVLTVDKAYSRALDLTFNAVLTGAASVADYQYSYNSDGGNTWSEWKSINIPYMEDSATGKVRFSVLGLDNDKEYSVKIRAINTIGTTESDVVKGTPKYIAVNYDDPNTVLAKATAEFIYAEDVPHSDFWRISETSTKGGRANSDRLVRGKETALGNLFADALQWYAKENGHAPDFSWLIGDMISTGIARNASITPRFLAGIISSDYQDDTVVIVKVLGSDLISQKDYDLDLNNYPAVGTNNGYATTLFGQAASVYRNGHYGGSGGTTYNGVWWGIPSAEAKYTIEYKAYDFAAFKKIFNSKDAGNKPACVAALDENDGKYDVINDPEKCYLLSYKDAYPQSGDPESSVMGYKRGRIKKDTLLINGQPVDPAKTYTIATTRKIAREMYAAFLKDPSYTDTGVTLKRAVSEYLYEQKFASGATPNLDGRIVLEGGVPGDSNNDFVRQYPK